MQIMLTVVSGLVLIAVLFVLRVIIERAEDVNDDRKAIDRTLTGLREQLARLTVLEREVQSLRRELRSLSGKFYASLRTDDEEEMDADDFSDARSGFGNGNALQLAACDNWALAQKEGPLSPAAACPCQYCEQRRVDRARQRDALVPKTAQAAAATAKLNAGKP